MSKTEKLIQKLRSGVISAKELKTLMKKLGWTLDRQAGSHEQWVNRKRDYPKNRITIATHTKDLKQYQIKEAMEKILDEK